MDFRLRSVGVVTVAIVASCGGDGVPTNDDAGMTTGDPPMTSAADDAEGPGMSNTGVPDDTGVATTISGMDDDSDGSDFTTAADSDPATSTTSDAGSSTDTGDDAVLELDPATLVYFELPIGSIRYAIGGQDLDSDTCVTLVWFAPSGQECGLDVDSPYAIVTPNATAPCEQWDYQGNVDVQSVDGCVEFIEGESLTATITMSLEVTGTPFTGTILIDNE